MIKYLLLIIIFIIIYNYKLLEYFNSIPNNDNNIENKNFLKNYFTNNRKIV